MLTDFYTIEAITGQGGEYVCSTRLNPGHDVYEGHFPGMPVVPGVCMLRMIKECISAILGNPVRFQAVTSCKFLSVVNPSEQEVLVFILSVKDSNKLQVTAVAGETTVLKLKATFIAG